MGVTCRVWEPKRKKRNKKTWIRRMTFHSSHGRAGLKSPSQRGRTKSNLGRILLFWKKIKVHGARRCDFIDRCCQKHGQYLYVRSQCKSTVHISIRWKHKYRIYFELGCIWKAIALNSSTNSKRTNNATNVWKTFFFFSVWRSPRNRTWRQTMQDSYVFLF